MAILDAFLGRSAQHAPEPDNDDTVIPAFVLDDTNANRAVVIGWLLRFDDVLDPNKLHDALCRLIEMDGWRKLGGRLRLNKAGKLEIHIPQAFTSARSAVRFTHETASVPIALDPLAAKLPRPSPGVLKLHPGTETFRPFIARPDAPSCVADYLGTDEPQLGLHITSFEDATLVGLTLPHTLVDAGAMGAIARAWSLVLNGRAAEVPPLDGWAEDVLGEVWKDDVAEENAQEKGGGTPTSTTEEYVLAPKVLSPLGMIRFALGMLWDMYWTHPVVQSHVMYVPASLVASLRKEATASMAQPPPFLSDGDILSAWTAGHIRAAYRAASASPFPLTIANVVDVRARLASLQRRRWPAAAHVQCLLSVSYALLPATEKPPSLGEGALAVRNALVSQTTEGQTRAFLRVFKTAIEGSGNPPLVGEPGALTVWVTNWTRAAFLDAVDFSGAVVGTGTGRLVYHAASSLKVSSWSRGAVTVLGKDGEGGYWISGLLVPRAWKGMEEEARRVEVGRVLDGKGQLRQ